MILQCQLYVPCNPNLLFETGRILSLQHILYRLSINILVMIFVYILLIKK